MLEDLESSNLRILAGQLKLQGNKEENVADGLAILCLPFSVLKRKSPFI